MPHRLIAAFLLLAAAISAGASCPMPQTELDRDAYKTPLAQAQADGLAVHWLGPSFLVAGASYGYKQAEYPEGVSGVRVDGLELNYNTSDGELWGLTIRTISMEEWPLAEATVRRLPSNADRSDVQVAGHDAELLTYYSETRPINGFETDEAAVVVTVPSWGSPAPGQPDANPLIDKTTFLAVMENLRPYPD